MAFRPIPWIRTAFVEPGGAGRAAADPDHEVGPLPEERPVERRLPPMSRAGRAAHEGLGWPADIERIQEVASPGPSELSLTAVEHRTRARPERLCASARRGRPRAEPRQHCHRGWRGPAMNPKAMRATARTMISPSGGRTRRSDHGQDANSRAQRRLSSCTRCPTSKQEAKCRPRVRKTPIAADSWSASPNLQPRLLISRRPGPS